MNITYLPPEMLEEVFSFLNVEDVLSCCLVSKLWRNILNKNWLWFKLCYQRYQLKKESLDFLDRPSIVEPMFMPLFNTFEDLTEICIWRLRFMQEAHITRNWKFEREVTFPIPTKVCTRNIQSEDGILVMLGFLKTPFTYHFYEGNGSVQLLHSTYATLRNMPVDLFKLKGGLLVICQHTLVEVYKKSVSGVLELSYRFLFDQKKGVNKCIPNLTDLTEWYERETRFTLSDAYIKPDHNGEYFVGFVEERYPKRGVLHLWDLKSGRKITELKVPDKYIFMSDFYLCGSDIYIKTYSFYTSIYCFSISLLEYTDFSITYNNVGYPVFGEKLVVTVDEDKNLMIWNRKDGSFINKWQVDFDIFLDSIDCVSSMIILGKQSEKSVKIFNTETLKIVCQISVDFTINNVKHIRSNLIFIYGNKNMEIWDFSTNSLVRTLSGISLWISPCRSKTVLLRMSTLENYYLLSFW